MFIFFNNFGHNIEKGAALFLKGISGISSILKEPKI